MAPRTRFLTLPDVNAPIAEPTPLMGNRLHAITQVGIVSPHRLISHRHPATRQKLARPPLTHLMFSLEMSDGFSLGSGRHHFFPRRSFSATLSNIASASNRFNLAFSSSRLLSLLASDTSMPPNLAFHL